MAKQNTTHSYPKCTITRVIDGDTFVASVDLGFYVFRKITIRLARVDTPEVRGKGKIKGLEVKAYVKELIENQTFPITCTGKGKFGRWICDIILPSGKCLSDHLLKKKMAKRVNY